MAALVIYCSDEAPTIGIPSGMGVVTSLISTFGLGRRKPGATTLIRCRQGSLALITHFGAWKLDEIGVYPRIRCVACN